MEQGFQVLLQVFGGLALFLYGTDSLCRAVQQGAGRRLRGLLARCTANPVAGLLTGAAVTAVLQSSSAVTVMVIAFLAAGLLQLRQAVPVVFGANIGTTVTAQLLAFRVESWRTGTTAEWSTPPCTCCTAASGISFCTISAWCPRQSPTRSVLPTA